MSLDPNSRRSTQAEDRDDSSLLFEDEENEQFLKALEQAPKSAATSKTDVKDVKKALDTVVPDVQEAIEEESEEVEADSNQDAQEEDAAEITPQHTLDDDVMSPLSQAPVQIQLELGKVKCSLQKLIELRPNDVLPLNEPISQMIDLRIEGRLVGRGQIVKLGDQLGLRISELADS